MDETFSSIDLVTQCLLDKERTEKFEEAINKGVKPEYLVLDSGTGSGILSFFAVRAGAKKVYSLEYSHYVATILRENIINNGFEDKINLIVGDARNLYLKEPIVFDLIIMEMLTTGMIDEHQVWTVNSLHQKGYANENTKFLPSKQETFVSLAETDFYNHGFNMWMVKHLWKFLPPCKINFLSETQLLNSISFNHVNPIDFSGSNIFDIKEDGVLNSVYLSSKTWLDDTLFLNDTLALNAPVTFPLSEDLKVIKGDKIELKVEYKFGNGYRNFNVTASKI